MAGAAANGVDNTQEDAMQQNGSKLNAAQRKKLKKKEREKAKKAAKASRFVGGCVAARTTDESQSMCQCGSLVL